MPIQFDCPRCQTAIQVGDEAAGKKGTCPSCRAKLRVPEVELPPPRMIEFDCPRCSASIQVPEESAGKRGRCPRCQAKLLIPSPDVPSDPGVQAADESAPWGEAGLAVLTERRPGQSVSTRVRRKQKGQFVRFLIPFLFLSILISGYGWYTLRPDPVWSGTLQADRLEGFEFKPVPLERSLIQMEEADRRRLDEQLTDRPFDMKTELVWLSLYADQGRLMFRLDAGRGAEVFRVDLKQRAGLTSRLLERQELLEKPRNDDVQRYAPEMLKAVLALGEEATAVKDALTYRNTVGLGHLTSGVGYSVVAVIKNTVYRCAFEDGDGRLYFLLPKGTTHFTLEDRMVSGGRKLFPGKYEVSLRLPKAPKREVSEPESELKSEPDGKGLKKNSSEEMESSEEVASTEDAGEGEMKSEAEGEMAAEEGEMSDGSMSKTKSKRPRMLLKPGMSSDEEMPAEKSMSKEEMAEDEMSKGEMSGEMPGEMKPGSKTKPGVKKKPGPVKKEMMPAEEMEMDGEMKPALKIKKAA